MACSCEVCCFYDQANSRPNIRANDGSSTPKVSRNEDTNVGNDNPTVENFQRVIGLTSPVNVYVLAKSGNDKLIEVYSGLDGNLVRVIPGNRFHNPQSIATGFGYLAVVDRFNNQDLIRVTNIYGGATKADFNNYGDPSESVNWENIPDLIQIPTKANSGQYISGISISPDGTLVANVANVRGSNGKIYPTFLQLDLPTIVSAGITRINSIPYCTTKIDENIGMNDCSSIAIMPPIPYGGAFSTTYDNLIGKPVWFDDRITFDKKKVFGLTDQNLVFLADLTTAQFLTFYGVPTGFRPVGITHTSNVLAVQAVSTNNEIKVFRFIISDDTGSFIGLSADFNSIPEASNYTVNRTYTVKDALSPVDSVDGLRKQIITSVEANFNEVEWATQLAGLDDKLANLKAPYYSSRNSNQDTLNYGRTIEYGYIQSSALGQKSLSLPMQVISTPPLEGSGTMSLVAVYCTSGVVGELYEHRNSEGEIDTNKSVFLLLHGTHYDYLSDGGYYYGCGVQNDTNGGGLTSGTIPLDIALDKDIESGNLRELPDLNVALVTSDKGRIAYYDPKPRGYNVYAGLYATLQLVQGGESSGCTTTLQDLAQELDGIDRQSYERANSNFDNTLELDRPYSLFKRRVKNYKNIVVKLNERGWNTTDELGERLEDWIGLANPGRANKGKNVVNYPPFFGPRDTHKFNISINSGFFFLGLQKVPSTQRLEYTRDRDELLEQQKYADQATFDSLQTQIDEINSRLAEDNEELDYTIYRTPRSVKNVRYSKLDVSAPQLIDPVEGGIEDTPTALGGNPPFTVVPIDGTREFGYGSDAESESIVPLRKGCSFKPGKRTWIAFEISLDRWEQVDGGGVSGWSHPQTWENGLGIRVEDYPTGVSEGFGLTGSAIYESGWVGDGTGMWEIKVKFDGSDPDSKGERIFYVDQLSDLAPYDAIGELAGVLMAGRGNGKPEKYHKGKVYMVDEDVKVVSINVKLINRAAYVFPIGYKTLRRVEGRNRNDGFYTCWQTDPGFYGDNTCESLGCGNVTCASFIFHGKKNRKKDPIYLWTRQVLWEGEATFSIPDENNPYLQDGLDVGKVMICNFFFDLNRPMNAFYVDLRDGKGPEAPGSRQ